MRSEFGPEGILHITGETYVTDAEHKETSRAELREDLQINYTDHLKSIENANMEMVRSVVRNAQHGFTASLVLNILSFILGAAIIVVGLILLISSPETLGRTVGVASSLIGVALVITLLFWRGPLERILKSASNLAQINAISLGLAHRLNQISRVFVHQSLRGEMNVDTLRELNKLTKDSVEDSVRTLTQILPEETAEKAVQRLLTEQMKTSPPPRDA
ncbi:MAG: hypothetical protein DRI01_07730, partial [Chloroflexi bacterium]